MAGINWQKYLMPEESFGVGGVDNTAMTDPYAFPQLDWMDAIKIKRMSEGPYSPYKTPFLGAEDQDTQFDPYNKPKVDVRNPPVDWNSAPSQGTLFDPYSGGAPTTSPNTRPTPPATPEFNRTGGPTDWARNAANTGFNPTYQNSNPITTPPIVAPRQAQARAPIPQVARPPRPAARPVASPVTQTGAPAPVSSQPSYTRMEPIDFGALLSGAAQKGGGSYGDFGASNMLGPEERAAQAAQAQRIANQPKLPEYDYGPMTRYQEYLKSEPEREKVRPGKWSTILNSLSAGMESMDKGVGAGVNMYDTLSERPYRQAYEGWKNRGARVAADVTMADTRYKNQVEAHNKRADNERADAALKLTERGVNINQAKLFLDIQKAADNGFQKITGPDGMMYMQKVQNGELVTIPTGMPATEYTVVQKMAEVAGLEAGRNYRHVTPSGSAVLGSQTSMFNTGQTIDAANTRNAANIEASGERAAQGREAAYERQRRSFDFTGTQNDATRAVTTRGQNVNAGIPPTAGGYPVAPGVGSPVPSGTPGDAVPGPKASSLASPLTTVTQAYKEFNNPAFVKIGKGDKGETTIEFNAIDSPVVKEAIKKMSGGDPELFKFYTDRWVALRKANGL